MIIKENGKLYNIDEETGLVTEASIDTPEEEVLEVEDLQEEFRTGDRVSVDDEEGTIISIISSVYGPAFGIRFDDGTIDEYPEEKLARVETEEPDYETPIKEVLGRYDTYSELPAFTREEIEAKIAEARNLNLRAKALITDSKLSFSDQLELDRVVLATGTDLLDFKEIRDSAEANQEYMARFKDHGYAMSAEFDNAPVMGASGDASWVDQAFNDIEETTDADLAIAAQEMVDALSAEQLQDEEFVSLASSFRTENLVANEEQREKFAGLVKSASEEKLKDYKPAEEEVEESDLDNFDTSSLYL